MRSLSVLKFAAPAACFFACCGSAQAHHCRIETPDVNFGAVDPLRIEGTETPVTIKLNCWAVTSPTHYCVTVKDNVPERFLSRGNYQIPFNFYHDNITLGNGGFGKPITGTIEPIKGQSTQYPQIALTAKLGRPEGLTLANGIYRGQFQTIVYGAYGRDSLSEAEKQAMCKGQKPARTHNFTEESQPFSVKAKIEKSCSVVADSINFGKVALLGQAKEREGRIRVKCSDPTHYQIGLSGGDNPQGASRAMKCSETDKCGGALVSYNIYQEENGGKIVWNDKWNTESVIRGFSANETQTAHFRAAVEGGQNTPPPGRYADTVLVTVRYGK